MYKNYFYDFFRYDKSTDKDSARLTNVPIPPYLEGFPYTWSGIQEQCMLKFRTYTVIQEMQGKGYIYYMFETISNCYRVQFTCLQRF